MSQSEKPSAAPAGRIASFRRLFGRPARRSARPRPRARLGLERLEAREVPALFTFSVSNVYDSGPGSLRDAFHQALGKDPVNDRCVVQFAPGLAGQTINLTSADIDHGANGNSSALEVASYVTVQGTGETITRPGGAGVFRLFDVERPAHLTLTDLTFSGGLATDRLGHAEGGAFLNNGGTLRLVGCTLTNNVAFGVDGGGFGSGGAISNEGGNLTLDNCTLTGNVASGGLAPPGGGTAGSGQGGAIYTAWNTGALNLFHCTVAGNFVEGDTSTPRSTNGWGVYTFYGKVFLTNSILSGPPGGLGSISDLCNNGGNLVTSANANAIPTANIIQDGIYTSPDGTTHAGGVIQADPRLGPLQDNGGPTQTMALLPGSPALAQVPVYYGITSDQRGAARGPGNTDLGAYEVQNPLSPVGVPGDPAILFGPHPTASPNEAFVKGLYQATLLRAGESAGVNFWVGQLDAGVSPGAVAAGFYNSAENRANETKFFYREFLGREADAAGLAYWVGVLQSGVDEALVMKGFLLSPEYSAQNDNGQFVSTMYYAILGRQGDASGFTAWRNALDANQLSRDQVADAFIRSTEAVTRVVANDYQAYLGRAATAGDVAFWVGPVQSGLSFGTVAAAVLGSGEFYAAAAANVF